MPILQLEGELSLAAAAAQRARLLTWLAAVDPASQPDPPSDLAVEPVRPMATAAPTLDLSAVATIDSAGVQLLLALRNSLADRGQVLHCQGAQPGVAQALQALGLTRLLRVRNGASQ